jgi:hypothetical protein
VVRDEARVDELFAEAQACQAKLIELRVALRFLAREKMIDDALREQVGHFLHDIHWVPSCVGQIEFTDYTAHPAAAH